MKTPQYMMATTAIHKLGNISSKTPDLCYVYKEDKDNYYGNWVEGLGWIDVQFPKSTTRLLSEKEYKYYSGKKIGVGNLSGQVSYTYELQLDNY